MASYSSAFTEKGVVCTPPVEFTVFDSEFCWLTRAVRVSFPNCSLVLIPNSAAEPRIRLEPVVIDTLPASRVLIISSSLPS